MSSSAATPASLGAQWCSGAASCSSDGREPSKLPLWLSIRASLLVTGLRYKPVVLYMYLAETPAPDVLQPDYAFGPSEWVNGASG